MPIVVRDDEIADMTAELRDLLQAGSETEVLRIALRNELQRVRGRVPMRQRLAKARAMADAIDPSSATFDQKAFSGSLWGED